MADVYSELIAALGENLASDPTGYNGRFYWNTVSLFPKYYNGTTWKTIADTNSAQVFTLKDYDGGTASNTNRTTLAKNTLANLTALTRKSGTIFFDTTNGQFVGDDGTSLTAFASAALFDPGVTSGIVDGVNGLEGFSDGSSAAAGYLGEYIESVVTFDITSAEANQYIDATTITLTAGDWEIGCYGFWDKNGATVAAVTELDISLITVAGNFNTGAVRGDNFSAFQVPSSSTDVFTVSVLARASSDGTDLTIAGTTTTGQIVRMKVNLFNVTAGTSKLYSKLWARRVR